MINLHSNHHKRNQKGQSAKADQRCADPVSKGFIMLTDASDSTLNIIRARGAHFLNDCLLGEALEEDGQLQVNDDHELTKEGEQPIST